ncbi:hypothetical protein ANCCAN_16796 [Ancylostoma caninum]|uniref:Uncharacterized protein n=1 Tax=Ancylostoma caninum TaxID=29170 RepID=A0A368FYP7_ANCCA|nr:hypothetical protein ANCCAN_16796 [Ancylostoma caninum]
MSCQLQFVCSGVQSLFLESSSDKDRSCASFCHPPQLVSAGAQVHSLLVLVLVPLVACNVAAALFIARFVRENAHSRVVPAVGVLAVYYRLV